MIENMKKLLHYTGLLFLFNFLFFATKTKAQIVPQNNSGNYTLNDFVAVIVNITDWILAISGSLALLGFIVGGAFLIFSGGNREYIDRGKRTLVGSIIGLFIVFSSFLFIQYILEKLGFRHVSFGFWDHP